jgi:gas vesicle protein
MTDTNEKKGKIRWTFDKLVMGAIVGGAIGSVLGMAIAPRKGKDTRKILKEKGKEAYQKGKEVYEKNSEKVDQVVDAAKNFIKKDE